VPLSLSLSFSLSLSLINVCSTSLNNNNNTHTHTHTQAPNVTETKLIQEIERLMNEWFTTDRTRAVAMTALLKISGRSDDKDEDEAEEIRDRVERLIAKWEKSIKLELQQRSTEYGVLLREEWSELRGEIVRPVPWGEEEDEDEDEDNMLGGDDDDDDDNDDDGSEQKDDGDILDNLFDDTTPTTTNNDSTATTGSGGDNLLDDLFGGGDGGDDDDGSGNEEILEAMNEDGIRIVLKMRRSEDEDGVTDVVFESVNNGDDDVVNFVLSAATPRYVKLEWKNLSGNVLKANGALQVTQQVRLTNTMSGKKKVMMKLKITYNRRGSEPQTKLLSLGGFPEGM